MAETGKGSGIPEGGFTDEYEVEVWLGLQPSTSALAVAWRMAGRVIPLIVQEKPHSVIFPTLYALAVSRYASIWNGRRSHEINNSARKSRFLAASASIDAKSKDAVYCSARSVYAASSSRHDAIKAAISISSRSSILVSTYATAAKLDSWRQLSLDASLLEKHEHSKFKDVPLWFAGLDKIDVSSPPAWVEDSWTALRRELRAQPLSQGWSTWIDWYDDILHGRPGTTSNPDIEFARLFGHPEAGVRITEDDWEAGPAVVNPKIRQVLDFFKVADALAEEVADGSAEPSSVLAATQPLSAGATFQLVGAKFKIVQSEFTEDAIVAQKKIVQLEFDDIKKKLARLAEVSSRVSNKQGWEYFHEDVQNLVLCTDIDLTEIAQTISIVWGRLVTLGGYLELDNNLRSPKARSNVTALDEDVRRPLSDLIRVAAPWVRQFPTAREKDVEAGNFLARPELLEPAKQLFENADRDELLTRSDVADLKRLLLSVQRGELQAKKAGAYATSSARNLIVEAAKLVAGGMVGATISAALEPEMNAAGQWLRGSAMQIEQIMADSPDDLRLAIQEIIDDLPDDPKGPVVLDALPPERRKK